MGEYITPAGLKGKRGWTDPQIRNLLGEPDKTAKNPHYSTAAPMRLYLIKKVESAEASRQFTRNVPDAKRKSAAAKAVKTKTYNLARWAENVKIWYDFPSIGGFHGSERQKVNYLRHECTAYEDVLCCTYGATGKDEAYHIIKNRILAEISRRFPDLAEEAERQSSKIGQVQLVDSPGLRCA